MGALDFLKEMFKPVPSMGPAEAVDFINNNKPGEFQLLDVRQPHEFAMGHLKKATNIPLGELGFKKGTLDRDKPTIIYCQSGSRSGIATRILMREGFEKVFNLTGGINALR